MTQMTRIYTEYWYNFKKISDNPRHLCHPRSNSGYVKLTLNKYINSPGIQQLQESITKMKEF